MTQLDQAEARCKEAVNLQNTSLRQLIQMVEPERSNEDILNFLKPVSL